LELSEIADPESEVPTTRAARETGKAPGSPPAQAIISTSLQQGTYQQANASPLNLAGVQDAGPGIVIDASSKQVKRERERQPYVEGYNESSRKVSVHASKLFTMLAKVSGKSTNLSAQSPSRETLHGAIRSMYKPVADESNPNIYAKVAEPWGASHSQSMTETCNTTSTSFEHELTPVAEDASTNLTDNGGSGKRGHQRIGSEETTHGTGSGRPKSHQGGEGDGGGIARCKQIMKAAFVELYSQKNLDRVQQGKQLSGATSKFEEALAATFLEIIDEFLGDLREKFDKSKCEETFVNIYFVAGIEVLEHQSQLWRVPAAVLRGLEEDHIVSGSRSTLEIQQAAKATLLAGATEVFRVCEVPEGWNKVEGKQVVAAAVETNTFIIGTDRIDAALFGFIWVFWSRSNESQWEIFKI
jgi:hypothetical protein